MYRALCAEATCLIEFFCSDLAVAHLRYARLPVFCITATFSQKAASAKREASIACLKKPMISSPLTTPIATIDKRLRRSRKRTPLSARSPSRCLGQSVLWWNYPATIALLRHIASVERICHAIAIDEHRTWFKDTTWGWLDSDAKNAEFFAGDPRYSSQKIKEVWFPGYHADVGAGGPRTWPFHWLFSEACELSPGLLLNNYGETLLDQKPLAGTRTQLQRFGTLPLEALVSTPSGFRAQNSDVNAGKCWR